MLQFQVPLEADSPKGGRDPIVRCLQNKARERSDHSGQGGTLWQARAIASPNRSKLAQFFSWRVPPTVFCSMWRGGATRSSGIVYI